jgi:uncharacterized protein YukE
MTSFLFNHGDHHVVVDFLSSAVNNLGTVLDDLNGFLRHMNEATQGQAAPLWEAQQDKWGKDYNEMQLDLADGTSTAGHIGELFFDGDRRAGQIMAPGR